MDKQYNVSVKREAAMQGMIIPVPRASDHDGWQQKESLNSSLVTIQCFGNERLEYIRTPNHLLNLLIFTKLAPTQL